MRRVPLALAAFVLNGTLVVTAEDPTPAQPAQRKAIQKAIQPKAVQPIQIQPRVTAAKLALLEEEVETLEAQRDVKKAHVRAAEISIRSAENTFDLVSKTVAGGVTTNTELNQAKFGLEMAKAQFEIRVAEMREVEVKIKHAKKRLEDAKAGGVRPQPGARPVDAPPQVCFLVDEKELAELTVKVEKLSTEIEKNAAASKKADAELKVAEKELVRIKEIAMRGRVLPGTIEKAEAKVTEAKEAAEKAAKQRKALEDQLAELQKKLKELGK